MAPSASEALLTEVDNVSRELVTAIKDLAQLGPSLENYLFLVRKINDLIIAFNMAYDSPISTGKVAPFELLPGRKGTIATRKIVPLNLLSFRKRGLH